MIENHVNSLTNDMHNAILLRKVRGNFKIIKFQIDRQNIDELTHSHRGKTVVRFFNPVRKDP